jgi:predicted ATPase
VTSLYTGELLPASYEEWVLARRQALHERLVSVLAEALVRLDAQRQYKTGVEYAETLLRLDPLHEGAVHYLILFRALTSNRAGALRAYQEGAKRLEEELGVSPAGETQELYEQLLREELQPEAAPPLAQPNQPPLIGREKEWQALLSAWQQMPKQGPHLLLVWGEAGMGKTRLVEELQQWATLRTGTVAYSHLYGAEGNLPFAPVTLWLRSAAMRQTLAKLEPLWLTELIRLLPELQQAHPSLPMPASMIEGWQQQRFYEALVRAIVAAPAPRLLILDDMQWCDGESLRWLRYLLRFDPKLPLLVVGTVRSEAIESGHPLHALLYELRRTGQYSELELPPLDAEGTITLAKSLAEGEQNEWLGEIYAESEGNPLFVVETVRARLNEGSSRSSGAQPAAIPSTIQAVIAARLAQLSPAAQQIVELAAAIGRTFSPAVLAAAVENDEDSVAQGLDELWRRRILNTKNEGYDFSHDKIREVAYAAIAPMQRRRLHRKVAQALETIYAADLTPVWGQLAIHYEAAQMPEQAISYLIHMAQQAEALDGFSEADAYYSRALSLHDTHLPTDRRGALDLLLMRSALRERQGQATGREQEIETMLALASALGEPERLATAHLRQASYLNSIGETAAAIQAGEAGLAIYRAGQNKVGEIQALRELGLICWSAQEYGNALRYGREVLLLHRQQSDVSGEATALHNLAEVYRSLGSPRQAITLYEEALQLYWMRREHRRQAITLYSLAYAYRQTARHDEALRYYQQARAFCEKTGDRLILSRVCHAVAILHWELQREEEALQAIGEAVEISRAIGHLPSTAYSLVAQGYMEAQMGRRELAHHHLEEALLPLNLMGDEEGIGEVQKRIDLLAEGKGELSEPPPALNWVRSHVVLTEGKVYCEYELPATIARTI